MNDEIRMGFCTLKELFDGQQWLEILGRAETLLGARLARLDVNDPVRKKVERLEEAAEYVCQFGEKEDSRMLHGKFEASKIEISIWLSRRSSRFPNSVDFYFPTKMADAEAGRLWEVFSELVRLLEPFYAFCDLQSVLAGKRKANRHSVDLEAELLGVFWFTHFNRKWVDFIGATRFDALSGEKTVGPGGATLRLGASLTGLGSEREASETLLGERFFVDPELGVDKRPGENALTFPQLRGQSRFLDPADRMRAGILLGTAVVRLLDDLRRISLEHEELTDTDVRDAIHLTLNAHFVWGLGRVPFPRNFRMFSREGNGLVAAAVSRFLDYVDRTGELSRVPIGVERLAVLQGGDARASDGTHYDEFIGHRDTPLPPEPLPRDMFIEEY